MSVVKRFQKAIKENDDKEINRISHEVMSKGEELEEQATSKIGKDYGIDFYELNEIIQEYSSAKIGTGAKAIEYILLSPESEREATTTGTSVPVRAPAATAPPRYVRLLYKTLPLEISGTIRISASPATSLTTPLCTAASLDMARSRASGPSRIQ